MSILLIASAHQHTGDDSAFWFYAGLMAVVLAGLYFLLRGDTPEQLAHDRSARKAAARAEKKLGPQMMNDDDIL